VERGFEKGGVSFRVITNASPVAAGRKDTPPMLKIVTNEAENQAGSATPLSLDEIAREGARRMLVAALEEEVASYIDAHKHERDDGGRALVVRNGKAKERKITVGSGTIAVRAPRVNDKRVDEDGQRQKFTSKILPPYMRKSPKVAEVLPILYLRGLSTGDFREALPVLLGEDAAGLSPTAITRLTATWEAEYHAFRGRDLSDRDYVYVWADGVHFNIRLEDDRLCTLVLIGVRPDGIKELIAVEDGYREVCARQSGAPVSLLHVVGAGRAPTQAARVRGALLAQAARVRGLLGGAIGHRAHSVARPTASRTRVLGGPFLHQFVRAGARISAVISGGPARVIRGCCERFVDFYEIPAGSASVRARPQRIALPG
jgi:hypothetical protein